MAESSREAVEARQRGTNWAPSCFVNYYFFAFRLVSKRSLTETTLFWSPLWSSQTQPGAADGVGGTDGDLRCGKPIGFVSSCRSLPTHALALASSVMARWTMSLFVQDANEKRAVAWGVRSIGVCARRMPAGHVRFRIGRPMASCQKGNQTNQRWCLWQQGGLGAVQGKARIGWMWACAFLKVPIFGWICRDHRNNQPRLFLGSSLGTRETHTHNTVTCNRFRCTCAIATLPSRWKPWSSGSSPLPRFQSFDPDFKGGSGSQQQNPTTPGF